MEGDGESTRGSELAGGGVGGIKGRRQMPRGRRERRRMMEINGEWQLGD